MYNGNGSKNSDFGLGVGFERKSLFQIVMFHQRLLPIVPKEKNVYLITFDFVEK